MTTGDDLTSIPDLLEKRRTLTIEELMRAYRVVAQLYPYYLSLTLWRSWEYAAYSHFTIDEPVLDIGCGDGRFFRLVWPSIHNAAGLDINPSIVEMAIKSAIYREVYVAPANDLPFESGSFASVFANCSLEHMDHLTKVVRHIARCLRPGGKFLFSVVSDKFLEWATLPLLWRVVGETEKGELLQSEYVKYQHLVHSFSPQAWTDQLAKANLTVEEYIPIVPELTARLFLFLDHLWHIPYRAGEVGDWLPGIFDTWPNFSAAIEEILHGFLCMERDWTTGCGVVFYARKSK